MTPKVRLTRSTDPLLKDLRDVRVAAEQVVFSGQPVEVIDAQDPQIDIHLILYGDQVAGMFRIDHGFHKVHRFAAPSTPGLRTFLVDHKLQGRGIAKQTCNQLRGYLKVTYPEATAVYLTVNLANPHARKAYVAGGFVDTGELWLKGEAGPQNILRLDL